MKTTPLGMRGIASLALLTLALCACESTYQTRSVETSGFLTNYEQLQKGAEGQALLVYFKPGADFKKYKKIMMDPITIYVKPKTVFGGVSEEDQRALVDYLDSAIRTQLGADYAFVKTPGPDVLRLRVALTETKGARVVLNVVSSIVPQAAVISGLKKLATGTASAVATTSAEMEMLDSQTGTRLAAAVDERAGSKYPGLEAKLSKWEQVRDAFDFWAVRLRGRLAELRGDAPPPPTTATK